MASSRALAAITSLFAIAALAGCAGKATVAASAGASDSASAGATPEVSAQCRDIKIATDADNLPQITDDAKNLAKISFKGAKQPSGMVVKTLKSGDGAKVTEDSLVTVDYSGWQWGKTEAFDSSATHNSSFTTQLSQVITGWRCGLAGHQVGERLLLSIPGKYAYGDSSQTGAPTGTLVFVVDIKDAVSSDELTAATKDATVEGEAALSERGIEVSGELGQAASISVKSGATEPTKPESIVVARGKGEALQEGWTVMVHLAMTTWDNSNQQSTWKDKAPQTLQLGQGTGLEGLVGLPVGSRVVVLIPGSTAEQSTTGQAIPAAAYVMDIEKVVSK